MQTDQSDSQSIDDKVRSRIYGARQGRVFTPALFLDLGSRDAVDQTLSRLAAEGTIRRLARGLYDYPKLHAVLGALLPSPEAIAKALVERDAVRVQPAGAYAANLLGLSEQVPATIIFLTDGRSRTVQVGTLKIGLRHTTPRAMAAAGRLSGLVIQAFRYLGQRGVNQLHVQHLRKTLPAGEREALMRDIKCAPAWMHPLFRELAKPGEH